jgi:methylphosphotriester-DNA--protein-cysteine methyltransferase
MTAARVVWEAGPVDLFGVRFRPGEAPAFLGVPGSEFRDAQVPLDLVWPDEPDLIDHLAHAHSTLAAGDRLPVPVGSREQAFLARAVLRARAAVMETMLRKRMRAVCAHDALVRAAVRRIENAAGQVSVRSLETELGATQRMLERRFAATVGLTPKQAARIARLQATAAILRHDPTISLARLAAHGGYHDQPHMTREFRSLAGLTPAAYARERRVGFVQDEILRPQYIRPTVQP